MEVTLLFIVAGACLAVASAALPSCPGDCYFGDFLQARMRLDLYLSPSCPLLNVTVGKYTSHEICFAKACELGANVVQYGTQWDERNDHHCAIYKCDSNVNGTDWDYGWVDDGVQRPVYARPHPFIPKCHSSYFRKRGLVDVLWRGESPCLSITNHTGFNLRDCMSAACHDKANLFRFFTNESPQRCETIQCGYNPSENDYEFNLYRSDNASVMYTLSHLAIDCNSQFKPEPIQLPLPACFDEVSLCGQGDAEEAFCKTGSNLIMYNINSTTRSSTALKCKRNHEGTGWDFYFIESICFGQDSLVKNIKTNG
ncbi:unnamed protein product [Owenia fusiformis]|uniref:Uncharacterized protein n=1 Tax=Owenia fusiformis TaxID=6347 RepID=A0A8J1UNC6_OWEFU|nr:unnamed protein product [Owenia fusiformis]